MSVEIEPHAQLGFPRPLTQVVKRSLSIRNPHPETVAFKVKTTAPKQYCVRPNSGLIASGDTIDVQVIFQPMKEDPPAGQKCKDKFLVQSTLYHPSYANVQDLWATITNKDEIHETKIRCAYLPAPGDTAAAVAGSTDLTDDGQGHGFQTVRDHQPSQTLGHGHGQFGEGRTSVDEGNYPVNLTATEAPSAGIGMDDSHHVGGDIARPGAVFSHQAPPGMAAAPVSSLPVHPPTMTPLVAGGRPAHEHQPRPAEDLAIPSAPSASTMLPPAKHTGDDEANLRARLLDATNEITRLRIQITALQTSGLRHRGVDGKQDISTVTEQGTLSTSQTQQQGGGVPLEVVATIALGVFVVTYLFF